MERRPDSHKGENGTVAVIGGSSTIHGAPLLSALAAQASGVDLLFVSLPKIHEHVARMTSLNFQVHPFHGNELEEKDISMLTQMLATMDSAVMGPGIARTNTSLKALKELIESASCPLVLDASALQPWTLETVRGRKAVLTPHLGELERLGISQLEVERISRELDITILVKGATDIVASSGVEREVPGGNAGLTVGGTGDALAGLVGGLMAQGLSPADSCAKASLVIKQAGTNLFEEKGFAYTTMDVIKEIPRLLKAMR